LPDDYDLEFKLSTDHPMILIAKFTGYFDSYNTPTILSEFESKLKPEIRHIVLDLSGYHYVGETKISSVLLYLTKAVKSKSGLIVIHSLKSNIREVF
jgi:anti-anti-sigma regulatory factor